MKKQIQGKAYVFGNNIDTDQIYPARYVEYTDVEAVKKYAMAGSSEPNLVNEFQVGDIIIAGKNFGCGSSREHAAITLKAIGAGAIIAESFGRIFFRNSINLGLAVIACPDISKMVSKGDIVDINIETGEINNKTTGATTQAMPMSEYIMNILESGGIKPMMKAMQAAKTK